MRTPRARVEREAPERVDDREREGQARHAPVADAPEGRGEHVELHEDDDEVEVAEARARRELEEEPRRARRAPVVLELVLQGAQFLVEEAVRRPVRAHVRQAQVEEERLPPRAPEPLVRDVQRPAQHRDDAVGHEDAPQAPAEAAARLPRQQEPGDEEEARRREVEPLARHLLEGARRRPVLVEEGLEAVQRHHRRRRHGPQDVQPRVEHGVVSLGSYGLPIVFQSMFVGIRTCAGFPAALDKVDRGVDC